MLQDTSIAAHSFATLLCPPAGPDAGDAKVALLTTLGCKFCRATKAELKGAGVAFQEIDLSRQLEVLRKAKEITGQSTVPQVGTLDAAAKKTATLCADSKAGN